MTYKITSDEERKFLQNYDASKYERPSVSVDIVVLTLDQDNDLNLLLIKRGGYPYKGKWALPGGFLNAGKESADKAAARELEEETGVNGVFLNQLYTFSDPARDPRTTVISIAYTALVPKEHLTIIAGDDADEAMLFKITNSKGNLILENDRQLIYENDLAFDHIQIVKTALVRIKNRIDYEPDAFYLLKNKNSFTIAELKKIYEAIKGQKLDLPNFRKMFFRNYVLGGLVQETGDISVSKGRPAKTYQLV